ncbi:cysteine desulfurase [Candidatus Pacearchaeota archaeon]|nr:cysteine desulfurase [Candidatus Pacearchaeota archaeon]
MKIYLDNAATTRVDDDVAESVRRVFLESYGNASSLHDVGREAKVELDEARKKIATYLGCDVDEIVFTSGGTESNNLAIRGLAKANPNKKHIVTSVIEHSCVLETCRDLEREGYEVDYLGVDSDGLVNVDDVREKIREDTLLVSVMHVNNEVGTVQPIEEIGRVCRKAGIYFHTDAVQGFLKVNLDLKNVDLMSVSGHKVCAPKGVGFLYIRKDVNISSIITGGGQEGGLRSGTENVPGVVGLAAALDVDFGIEDVRESRDKIVDGLKKIKRVKINGSMGDRVYNNISVSFYGIDGESLMLMLNEDGICVSTGSACAAAKLRGSHVLKAMGVDEMYINGSLRLSLGVDAIGKEEHIVERIGKHVAKLREISPFKFSDENLGGSSTESKGGSHPSNVDGSESKILGGSASLGAGSAELNVDKSEEED